ncbi:Pimeloyl-ACP methyl ester carboxylesterase [Ruminococcaceae bacterium YRB3002]|nr:Pimeloyl-ACP methyl ester carboxylesterase [Ruminococcaceae bacterium YRB3002]
MKTQINTVTKGDIAMRYCRFGQGDGVFVIIPGISLKSVMDSASAVANQYSDMAEKYTIYMFDRRENIPDTYTIRDMARDTAAVMKELGLEKVNLFGASQGGMISLVITIEYPELVGSLILGSTAARIWDGNRNVIDSWISMAEAHRTEELCMSFGEKVYPSFFFEQYRDAFAGLARMVTDEDLDRFITIARGCEGFDVLADAGKIQCPALVLGAADDAVLGPGGSEEIMAALEGRSGCESYMYDGYGHAAFDTAPDYRARIMDFIAASRK